jgi:hypothetical protein
LDSGARGNGVQNQNCQQRRDEEIGLLIVSCLGDWLNASLEIAGPAEIGVAIHDMFPRRYDK